MLLIFSLSAGLALAAVAQEQTGSIKGRITDTEGFPLPGAFVYIDSPSMLDIQIYITSETGLIHFRNLPAGTYRLTVEMPGFKTVNIEDIIIQVGMSLRYQIAMEVTTIEEETTIKIPSQMGDPESIKISGIIEENLIGRIPINRDLHNLITLAPGIISESTFFPKTSIIHGSTARSNLYAVDNMSLNDPAGMHLVTNVNFDTIEEVEVITGGIPTQVGAAEGGYINVVTKSGGNNGIGQVLVYHTSESLTNPLTSKQEQSSTSVPAPALDKKLWDFSLSLGGPILQDKLWYFLNTHLISQSRSTAFIPWTDPHGKEHKAYDWDNSEKMAFIKFTSQFVPYLKVTALFNYVNRSRPFLDNFLDWNVTADATRNLDHENLFHATGILNYTIDQNTSIDIKAGYFYDKLPLFLQENVISEPSYVDIGSGHLWGSGSLNEKQVKKKLHASAYVTRFQDDILGTSHELKVGGEYEFSGFESIAWKENNLTIYYNQGNPYFFGLNPSPSTSNTVGKGMISFLIASKREDEYFPRFELQRLSLVLQDTITFVQRFTLNLGIRFDRSTTTQTSLIKLGSGNPLSVTLGENLIEPTASINPYGEFQISPWKNMISWNVFSPRLGFVFDVFGDGKSLFSVSYSRYTEQAILDYAVSLSQTGPSSSHSFYWYDENLDSTVDEDDTFIAFPEDYRLYNPEYGKSRIDPDITSPHTNEITVSLHQEIFADFSVRLTYISKDKKNIFEDVLYSIDSEQDWYTIDLDTEGWWVPFQTIIPEIDGYKDKPVTVYFPTPDAPLFYERFKNVPELSRKYRGFEIAFKKRMSHNWQLMGSVTLSKTTGNIGLGYFSSSGSTMVADTPNSFVNIKEDARLDYDRPFILKLAGTYRFPFDIHMSFFYMYTSGTPWARSVTIFPPSQDGAENSVAALPVTVFLENPGTRRTDPFENMNIRIEKEFVLSRTKRISILCDVFNVLGKQYQIIVKNDGGFWYPSEESSTNGIRIVDPSFKKVTSLQGARSFRLGLNFKF
ncbi:MAG: TonB-dependent receptor [Candidatus Aminicenantes bacterium]|nr:MAG: TonB-dependent receptor [Candidatus Aminicenantes bacterium]